MTEELWRHWHKLLFIFDEIRWTSFSQSPLSEECPILLKHDFKIVARLFCTLNWTQMGIERVGIDRDWKNWKMDCNGACPDDIKPPPFTTAQNQAYAIMTVMSQQTMSASLECSGSETECDADLEMVQRFSFDSVIQLMSVTVKICIHWSPALNTTAFLWTHSQLTGRSCIKDWERLIKCTWMDVYSWC